MIASYEWTERHLTPNGWVRGSEKTDFSPSTEVAPPVDRVLTVRYIDEQTGYGGEQRVEEMWRSDDEAKVQSLLAQHGLAKASL